MGLFSFWKKLRKKDKKQRRLLRDLINRFPFLKFLPMAAAIVLGLALLAIFNLQKNTPQKEFDKVQQVQEKPAITTSVSKTDKDWLTNYCKEQRAALPEAPFGYEEKQEEYVGTIPPTYITSRLPEDKKFKSLTCRMTYDFDTEKAYASMGVEYIFDINYANEFHKRVDEAHTAKIDSTWKKISPIDNKEAGRPFYMYKGLPLVFTRENKDLGTLEYATMEFGVDYFVRFTVYEK